jgi:hypothetical protein
MSKQLYEEALADAKKLKEIAEDNAKRALVEAVTPRIRDLIEKELLREYGMDEVGEPGGIEPEGELMTDDMLNVSDEYGSDFAAEPTGVAVEPPMFGGEYFPNQDTEDSDYYLDDMTTNALSPMTNMHMSRQNTLEHKFMKLGESIANIKRLFHKLHEQKDFSNSVSKLISLVENMYDHVQGSISDSKKKNEYELTLESFYKELNKLQEQNMRSNRLRRLHEKKLAFSVDIPDLPDDLSLDDVTIEITPEDGGDEDMDDMDDMDDMGDEDMEGGDEDLDDMGGDDDMGDMGDEDMEGGDEDMDDMGGDEEEEPTEESHFMESRRLRDNMIVEIDEGMLRREIGRMKVIRESRNRRARHLFEEAVPSTKGHGPGKSVRNFGGGKSSGDPWLDAKLSEMDENEDLELESGAPEEEGGVVESRRFARNGARYNGAPSRRAVQAESKLRAKLAESNLFNAKLIYTNKLLQNESLSKRQKAEVIERLDEARTLREVKLVYESLTKTLAGTSRPLSESRDRKVLGSSSRATRPASTSLNEGFETDRWARLAGIVK